MTINDVKIEFHNRLSKLYEINEINSLFYMGLDHIGISKIDYISNKNTVIFDIQSKNIHEILIRLSQNEPFQYIINKAYFRGLEFFVNNAVLIPRQETEILIHSIIQKYQNQSPYILDLGTGSGIIAICLALEIEKSNVYALDISSKALEVANQNAVKYSAKIEFIESDMKNMEIYNSLPNFDIIVSNPPYICTKEKIAMKANVLDYEPHSALFVEDSNPLEFYIAIAEIAKKKLKKDGYIYCEINEALGNEVIQLFEKYEFINCSIIKDLHNKDRFVKAKIT